MIYLQCIVHHALRTQYVTKIISVPVHYRLKICSAFAVIWRELQFIAVIIGKVVILTIILDVQGCHDQHIHRLKSSHCDKLHCKHAKIWQTLARIDPSHKSHNVSPKYPTIHRFVTEMCTQVHISVSNWCIVGYGTGALWDLCNKSIGIMLAACSESGQILALYVVSTGLFISKIDLILAEFPNFISYFWQHYVQLYIEGLVQYCSNFFALAMELVQSCTKLWTYMLPLWAVLFCSKFLTFD